MAEHTYDRREVDAALEDLIKQVTGGALPENLDIIKRIAWQSLKLARDGGERLDLKIMERSLFELRRGFKAFAPWRDKRKIAVFGSARVQPDHATYKLAARCARLLVESGFMVVTGAGPGIMQAANEGAGREHSFGVNIVLPFEQEANPVIAGDPKLVNFRYFFTRKVVFVKETDGCILFPGGFGTQDEGFETLTLIQTGKSEPEPIVMVDPPGSTYWRDWDRWVRRSLLDRGLISPDDVSLYHITQSIEDAVDYVERFYRNFHSIRYVRGRLVIRLGHPPSDELIEELNDRYANLLAGGSIHRCEVSEQEIEDEPDLAHLHRLRLHFDRRHFGKMRRLIDDLNDSVSRKVADTHPKLRPVHVVTPDTGAPDDHYDEEE